MATTSAARRTAETAPASRIPADARNRIAIEQVTPCVDGGRFPAKCVVGERVAVEADLIADGHDLLAAVLRFRHAEDRDWQETRLEPLVNDRWRAAFTADRIGPWEFSITAWVDRFGTWRRDLARKHEAGQDVTVELLGGAALVEAAAGGAEGAVQKELLSRARALAGAAPIEERVKEALDERLADLAAAWAPRPDPVNLPAPLAVFADRERARYSTWYELFPRSASPEAGRHGTLRDVETRLPYVAELGFDVLYLPPIHPIGRTFRKGRNNAPKAARGDVGSPWAIGAAEGGHKAVHPDLGTLKDFDRLVAAAAEHGIEVAMDLAYQCSPDHPYLKEHPEWFRQRPDGTIQYAENPPKKYQDIYPFDFECEQWQSLWAELKSIVDFWIDHGVRIFRVDNPHTKAFPFWEWLIAEIRRAHPDVIFLAEAFTRPKVMYRLAKLGFSQSYTYFAWRNHAWEIEQYFRELTTTPVVDFFRPNAWPNTPDILTEYLQSGGRPATVIRLVLAATLAASYGIYGPPFEMVEVAPREPGSEEYLDSEKYQLRHWDLARPDSLRDVVARVNRIRRENPGLQQDRTLRFHHVDNDAMLCYSKTSADESNLIITVVNTNPHGAEAGTVSLDLPALGLDADQPFQVHDLLTDARYVWRGHRNYCALDPATLPAHILRVRRHVRTEQDFEYFL